jgi:hypothetical protein
MCCRWSTWKLHGSELAGVSGRCIPVDGECDADDEAGAGLQSHSTAPAISSARPRRPIGWFATASGTLSSPLAIISVTIGVSIVPGQTALIRMPRGAYSSAALRVTPMTRCLEAW